MGKKNLTESDLRLKIARFCSYQERSPKQVADKLKTLTSEPNQISKVLDWAANENFVSEQRFAEVYANGKFKLKNWGRFKIRMGLRDHGIAEELISSVLKDLDSDDYKATLLKLGRKKWQELKKHNKEDWQKTMNFLVGKGFEVDLINELKKQIEE